MLTLFLFPIPIIETQTRGRIGVESLPTKVTINNTHAEWRELVAIARYLACLKETDPSIFTHFSFKVWI